MHARIAHGRRRFILRPMDAGSLSTIRHGRFRNRLCRFLRFRKVPALDHSSFPPDARANQETPVSRKERQPAHGHNCLVAPGGDFPGKTPVGEKTLPAKPYCLEGRVPFFAGGLLVENLSFHARPWASTEKDGGFFRPHTPGFFSLPGGEAFFMRPKAMTPSPKPKRAARM